MKKSLFIFFVLFVIGSGLIFGQSAPGFDNSVDFAVSMKELGTLLNTGNTENLKSKYLILNGAVSSYTVTDKEEASYTVEVELVNGEWSGVADVFIYRSIIVFKGRQYMEKFPARRSSTPDPEEIPINSGLIIVAKYSGNRKMGNMNIPVLDGYYLRIYK